MHDAQIRHHGDAHAGACISTDDYLLLQVSPRDDRTPALKAQVVMDAAEDAAERAVPGAGKVVRHLGLVAVSVVVAEAKEVAALSLDRCLHKHGVVGVSIIDTHGRLHELKAFAPHTDRAEWLRRKVKSLPPSVLHGEFIDELMRGNPHDCAYELGADEQQLVHRMLWDQHPPAARALHVEFKKRDLETSARFGQTNNRGKLLEGEVPMPHTRSELFYRHHTGMPRAIYRFPPQYKLHIHKVPMEDGKSVRELAWVDFGDRLDAVLVLFARGMTGLSHFPHRTLFFTRPPTGLAADREAHFKATTKRVSLISLPMMVLTRLLAYPGIANMLDPHHTGTILIALQKAKHPHPNKAKHPHHDKGKK